METLSKTVGKYDLMYSVDFVGDYFSLHVCVFASDEEKATREASRLIREHYGWTVEDYAYKITAQCNERED